MAEGPRKLDVVSNRFDVCGIFSSVFKAKSSLCKINYTFLALFAILIFITSTGNAFGSNKTTPLHHFNLPCTNCHLPGPNNSGSNVSVELNGDLNNLCASVGCHSYDSEMTHPMGTLSLDEPVTCLSCHDDQTTEATASNPDLGMERQLQTSKSIELCSSCHTNPSGSFSANQHWQTNMPAHLKPMTPGVASQTDTGGSFIDKESGSCLGCHDEVSANIRSGNEVQKRGFTKFSSLSNHPIGMDYRNVAMTKTTKYNYPLVQNEKIRFFDGKMGCGSCHNLYSKEKKYLVQSNYRSALCFECHNL